jgi:hypothetical protein
MCHHDYHVHYCTLLLSLKIVASFVNSVGFMVSFTSFVEEYYYTDSVIFELVFSIVSIPGIFIFLMKRRLYLMIWLSVFTPIWIACFIGLPLLKSGWHWYDANVICVFLGLLSWDLGVATLTIWKKYDDQAGISNEASSQTPEKAELEAPLINPELEAPYEV